MKLQEALLKYFYVILRLFQIIKSQSFHFKTKKENASVFTALLLFKSMAELYMQNNSVSKKLIKDIYLSLSRYI